MQCGTESGHSRHQLRLLGPDGVTSFFHVDKEKPTEKPQLLRKNATATSVSCGQHIAASCKMCPQGNGEAWCHGDCAWNQERSECVSAFEHTHPAYQELVALKPFQPVVNENGEFVDVILVRHFFMDKEHKKLFEKYKAEILFLGIMSYEKFPLVSPNPWSYEPSPDEDYLSMFPGWFNMYRNPEEIFKNAKHNDGTAGNGVEIKVLDMSQSDFDFPRIHYEEEVRDSKHVKQFDFTYVMSDLSISASDEDQQCDSWGAFAKNWTFVRDHALDIMCGELNMTGVLILTKDKESGKACKIPASCQGKILQTPFLHHSEVLDYIRQSRFLFLPQICDASPRVATEAMSLNVPLLMNHNIVGGWKYINNHTGEFFHDQTDLKEKIGKLMETLPMYTPRQYLLSEYGRKNAGPKMKAFVEENFSDKVDLRGSKELIPVFN